jgi:hypothetical protein
MTEFWLFLIFVSVTGLTYGLLTLRGLRRDSETPAE